MKKSIIFILALALLLLPSLIEAKTTQETKTVKYNGLERTFNIVYIDPKDRSLEIRTELASGGIGATESLASIAKRTGAIAAINGNYFNAYTNDKQPHGNVQVNGQFLHTGQTGTTVGFSGNNTLVIANVTPKIIGGKNGSWEYPNAWYAWGINHDTTSTNQQAIIIFTPANKDKKTIGENAISVVVQDGKVTSIVDNNVTIPDNGYVIRIGKQAGDNILNLFKVGDLLEYKVEAEAVNPSGSVEWSNIRAAIGAGPILVHKGKASINFARDGMTDPKITTDRGMRGFIGTLADGRIAIGTVPNLNMTELAGFLQSMGFVEAMGTDGGASVGIFYNGKMVTTPGREISNAIVFIEYPTNLPRISVNSEELFLDVRAYLDFIGGDKNKGVTMIPVRGVLEKTGATIEWNAQAKKVTATRGNQKVELAVASKVAYVNGKAVNLDMPATIKSDRIFVPIRFISESLGDQVTWNQNEFMVYIESRNGNATRSLNDILNEANAFNTAKDYSKATELYKEYVSKAPSVDESVYNRYGWSAYSSGDLELAIKVFTEYTTKFPSKAGGYYGLASSYQHNRVNDLKNAEENFRKVIELAPNTDQGKTAQEFINNLGSDLHKADEAYGLSNWSTASDYYTSYIESGKNVNETFYNRWGWASYNAKSVGESYIKRAERAFKAYIEAYPQASGGYNGLSITYRLPYFKDQPGIENAIIANYNKVIELNPNSDQAKNAREYLESVK